MEFLSADQIILVKSVKFFGLSFSTMFFVTDQGVSWKENRRLQVTTSKLSDHSQHAIRIESAMSGIQLACCKRQ
jgi:hypothetical protein